MKINVYCTLTRGFDPPSPPSQIFPFISDIQVCVQSLEILLRSQLYTSFGDYYKTANYTYMYNVQDIIANLAS